MHATKKTKPQNLSYSSLTVKIRVISMFEPTEVRVDL